MTDSHWQTKPYPPNSLDGGRKRTRTRRRRGQRRLEVDSETSPLYCTDPSALRPVTKFFNIRFISGRQRCALVISCPLAVPSCSFSFSFSFRHTKRRETHGDELVERTSPVRGYATNPIAVKGKWVEKGSGSKFSTEVGRRVRGKACRLKSDKTGGGKGSSAEEDIGACLGW